MTIYSLTRSEGCFFVFRMGGRGKGFIAAYIDERNCRCRLQVGRRDQELDVLLDVHTT